jgi:hypothetical protein
MMIGTKDRIMDPVRRSQRFSLNSLEAVPKFALDSGSRHRLLTAYNFNSMLPIPQFVEIECTTPFCAAPFG